MSNPMSFEGTQWAMVGTSQGQEVWVHAEGYVNLYNAATDEVTELDAMPELDSALALPVDEAVRIACDADKRLAVSSLCATVAVPTLAEVIDLWEWLETHIA